MNFETTGDVRLDLTLHSLQLRPSVFSNKWAESRLEEMASAAMATAHRPCLRDQSRGRGGGQ